MIKKTDSVNIAFYEMFAASASVFIYLLFSDKVQVDISTTNWMYLIILGTLATAFAFVMSVEVMKVLSPFSVNLAVNLEIVYAIIFGFLIFGDGEQMTPTFYICSAMILLLIVFNEILKRQRKKRKLLKEKVEN